MQSIIVAVKTMIHAIASLYVHVTMHCIIGYQSVADLEKSKGGSQPQGDGY